MVSTEPASEPKRPAPFAFARGSLLQNLVFVFCLLFGLTLIFSTQAAADGGWFWYATFLRSGQHLYSGLHLALQPLFVLETSACLGLFGKGWLVMKIPAVLHMAAFALGFFLLVRQANASGAEKAIVLACAFFASISFEAYRFDDYHVLSDCFELYSLIALLALAKAATPRKTLVLTVLLGLLSGLAITNRLNDGGALLIGAGLGILCLAPARKLLSAALFAVSAALTVLFVVRLTGDSFHDYIMSTVFKAVGDKGGAGSVLTYPLHLPINAAEWVLRFTLNPVTLYSVAIVVFWTFAVRAATRDRPRWERIALLLLGVGLIALFLHWLYQVGRNALLDTVLLANLSGVGVLIAYGLAIWVAARFVWWALHPRRPDTWDHREILYLIPVGQLASGSMSSAGSHIGLYGPLAVLLVLLFIFSPIHLRYNWQRDALFAFAILLIFTTVSFRWRRPMSWHTYVEKPLFTGRTWYHHPVYGPMIIDRDLLQMIQPVCQTLHQHSATELLSLPWSYANYFCNIPPWHGYVQTFFDTTSKQTIDGLMDQLRRSPPQWIFYQRQLNTLRLHEITYNQGKPLEQRYLDQLIEQKIAQGDWHVVYTSNYGDTSQWDNHWLLIRTR